MLDEARPRDEHRDVAAAVGDEGDDEDQPNHDGENHVPYQQQDLRHGALVTNLQPVVGAAAVHANARPAQHLAQELDESLEGGHHMPLRERHVEHQQKVVAVDNIQGMRPHKHNRGTGEAEESVEEGRDNEPREVDTARKGVGEDVPPALDIPDTMQKMMQTMTWMTHWT